jgi:hypothetical protein
MIEKNYDEIFVLIIGYGRDPVQNNISTSQDTPSVPIHLAVEWSTFPFLGKEPFIVYCLSLQSHDLKTLNYSTVGIPQGYPPP